MDICISHSVFHFQINIPIQGLREYFTTICSSTCYLLFTYKYNKFTTIYIYIYLYNFIILYELGGRMELIIIRIKYQFFI